MMLLTDLPKKLENIFDEEDDGWVMELGSKSNEVEDITFGLEDDQWMLAYYKEDDQSVDS